MWVPQWLAILFGAGVVALVAVLAFAAQYGGLQHAWNEYSASNVSFENTTDTLLCAGNGSGMLGCDRQIRPRETTKWSTEGCVSGQTVTVYDPAAQKELYRRSEACGVFDGQRIVINLRDGEFIVADSLVPGDPRGGGERTVAGAGSRHLVATVSGGR